MSSGLTILTPGGVAMASEDVFSLMNQARLMASACDTSAWRLRMVTSMAPGVHRSVSALCRAKEQFDALATSLHLLAAQAADQEAWRQRNLHSLRDRFLYTAVAGAAWSRSGKSEAWIESITSHGNNPATSPSRLKGGVEEAAMDDAAAVLAGPPGALPAVSVTPVFASGAVTPARSMAERIARIPDTRHPIRVETYRLANGDTHADVFIAGTHEWGVGSGKSPFDLESNLKLVAGHTALSVVATTQALRHAGIRPGDSVSFVGHSQGGAVATVLAESGVYKTAGLVTAGSPTGTLPVRGDYPAVVLEHTNDIVPSFGGERLTTQATVVTRDSGHRLTDVYGAHSTNSYQHTAALIDKSAAPELAPMATLVSPGESGRVVVFSASRLLDQQQPG